MFNVSSNIDTQNLEYFRLHLTLDKTQVATSAGKHVEEVEHSHTVGGSVTVRCVDPGG